ncbi:YkgJ family cysteine cluster protein [Treponema zioleckii]|uniref:YkgJ family cysteine cluster protein n=1 Tax=Treponema zioleckii TaxID=331680 RepID=UPI00168B8C36|nr:YkgJ family cysteine cluster protein [Treponema zioleckii]
MFYEKGLKFSCNRCSGCCRLSPGYVYLSWSDLTNLCRWFKVSFEEFVKVYCRWVQYYDDSEVLCLKEKTNYDCILWKTGVGCEAYENRPVQCSTFPFWTWMLESEKVWNECASDCPGINAADGKLWSKEEIEQQRNAYENNKPIHKNEFYSRMVK